MKKTLVTLMKVFIRGSIIYFLFRGIDIKSFKRTVVSVTPIDIIFTAVLFFLTQCVAVLRWSIMLSKDIKVPYPRLFSIFFIGMFFNNFLPTIVGGDVIKDYYLYKLSGSGNISISSVFMDRYLGFSAMIILTTIALIFGSSLLEGTGLVSPVLFLILAYLSICLVLWTYRPHKLLMSILARFHLYGVSKKVDVFYKVLMSYKKEPSKILKALLCSFFIQVSV